MPFRNVSLSMRLRLRRRHSLDKRVVNGKAQPFRTEGGKAADATVLMRALRVLGVTLIRTSYPGPNRCRYSAETINAFTISALTKLPLN
jgi:hypothetical protein